MKNYLLRIKKLKKGFSILKNENFYPATSGTHYKVFLSDNYTIRFRDNDNEILNRESDFLKKLDYELIPKVLWMDKIDNFIAMVENRLPGKTINKVWKTITKEDQKNIIKQIIKFLQYLQSQGRDYIYSVNTGKEYNTPDFPVACRRVP